MALRAVPDHPKFANLKALLKMGKATTLGHLECIWHFAGRFTPQGNIGKYGDSEIENWVEWPGEPGALIAALVESKWLDRDDTHRLLVHDWPQHADKATKNALKRAELDFCRPSGCTPSVQGTHSVRTPDPDSGTVSRLPEPEPEPVPEPVPGAGPETPSAGQTAAGCDHVIESFGLSDEVWKGNGKPTATPTSRASTLLLSDEAEAVLDQCARRIHARHPAIRRCGLGEVKKQLRAIARRAQAVERVEMLLRVDRNHAGWCAWPDWRKDEGQYAKGLDNWLAPTKERWNEPPPNVADSSGPKPPKLMM